MFLDPGAARPRVTAATLLGWAGRPGEIGGIGPVDPDLARDLARAAAANPKTTWCVTVTDRDGHAIGHGCARPAPRDDQARRGTPSGHDPPGSTGPPRFTPSPRQAEKDHRGDGGPGGFKEKYRIHKAETGTRGRVE
jgi:hypothetical protein